MSRHVYQCPIFTIFVFLRRSSLGLVGLGYFSINRRVLVFGWRTCLNFNFSVYLGRYCSGYPSRRVGSCPTGYPIRDSRRPSGRVASEHY